jgi:hypothetical protein
MTRLLMAVMALLSCGSAFAQVGGMSISPGSPLGVTSPLGIGPGTPVAPTGIPLGATQLVSPGVSPLTSGTSPLGLTASSITTCSGVGGSMPQTSFGLASSTNGTTSGIFDGGGTAGTASGACAATASSSLAGPAASASSPTGMGSASSVGRIGIPLGSTELGAGGLSPPPATLPANPSAPVLTLGTTPCPTIGTSATTGTTSTTGTSATTGTIWTTERLNGMATAPGSC